MALVGVELKTLVSEPDARTTRPAHPFPREACRAISTCTTEAL